MTTEPVPITQGFPEWLVTMSLAGRYRARLNAIFTLLDTTGSILGPLREFDLMYRQELKVSLWCAASVIL